jgi:hypothetical protein
VCVALVRVCFTYPAWLFNCSQNGLYCASALALRILHHIDFFCSCHTLSIPVAVVLGIWGLQRSNRLSYIPRSVPLMISVISLLHLGCHQLPSSELLLLCFCTFVLLSATASGAQKPMDAVRCVVYASAPHCRSVLRAHLL